MTALTAFGLFAVAAMLVFYALEKRSPWFIFAFALACALASIYGFCKARGRLARSKRCGQRWRYAAGGWRGQERTNLLVKIRITRQFSVFLLE
jgi:hypothetical protein